MFSSKPKAKSQKSIVYGRKKSFSSRVLSLILPIAYCLLPIAANAQCAMCRASLESEEGHTKAEAVNDGIVYLMAFPYLLIGGLGYYIYRTRQQKKQ